MAVKTPEQIRIEADNIYAEINQNGARSGDLSSTIDRITLYGHIVSGILARDGAVEAANITSTGSGGLGLYGAVYQRMAEALENLDDHFDAIAGTEGNLAQQSVTIAEQTVKIKEYLDTATPGNLASMLTNIAYSLDANQVTVELTVNTEDIFLINEIVTGGASGRVLSQHNGKIYIDNASGSFTGTITGATTGSTATITDYSVVKNLGTESRQHNRQADSVRLYLENDAVARYNATIDLDPGPGRRRIPDWSGPDSITLFEGDELIIRIADNDDNGKNGYGPIWIVDGLQYFPLTNNLTFDKIAVPNGDNLSGNGSHYGGQIVWKIPYGTSGTYYFVSEDLGVQAPIIIKSRAFTRDEKITGSIKGNGHIEKYTPTSERGLRVLQIYDINHEFQVGETVTGESSKQTAVIKDIIHFNNEAQIGGSGLEDLAGASIYKTFIEEGFANKTDNNVSGEEQSDAIKKMRALINGARNI